MEHNLLIFMDLAIDRWSFYPHPSNIKQFNINHLRNTVMKKMKCAKCGWIYDPAIGDPKNGIPPGTPFKNLPADWRCPVCKQPKSMFFPTE